MISITLIDNDNGNTTVFISVNHWSLLSTSTPKCEVYDTLWQLLCTTKKKVHTTQTISVTAACSGRPYPGDLNTTAEDQRVFVWKKKKKKEKEMNLMFPTGGFSWIQLGSLVSEASPQREPQRKNLHAAGGRTNRGTHTWLQPVEKSKVRLIGWRPCVILKAVAGRGRWGGFFQPYNTSSLSTKRPQLACLVCTAMKLAFCEYNQNGKYQVNILWLKWKLNFKIEGEISWFQSKRQELGYEKKVKITQLGGNSENKFNILWLKWKFWESRRSAMGTCQVEYLNLKSQIMISWVELQTWNRNLKKNSYIFFSSGTNCLS